MGTRELLGLFFVFYFFNGPLLSLLSPLISYRKLSTWHIPCLLSSSLVHMCNNPLPFHMRLFIVLFPSTQLLNHNFYKFNDNSFVFFLLH